MKLRALTTNILGAIIIVGAATGVSLVALARPSIGWKKPEPPVSAQPAPVTEAPAPQPAPAPTPEPTPAPQPTVATATTVSFVRLRKGPSTSTDVLAELQGGTKVTLLPDANSLWQQVQYGNLVGYVYKSYLQY